MKNRSSFKLSMLLIRPGIIMIAVMIFAGILTVTPATAAPISGELQGQINQLFVDLGLDDVHVDFNVEIPMTAAENPVGYDCTLSATVMYHTSEYENTGSIKRPTIFLATAYNRLIMGLLREVIAFLPKDYNIVMVDMRGTAGGEGIWDALGPVEQYDAVYMIDKFIPSQPWSDGTVGMVGGSYEATLAYTTSALVETDENGDPVHLKCMAPISAISDTYNDIAFHGGNFNEEFMSVWMMITDLISILPVDVILAAITEGVDSEAVQTAVDILESHANQLDTPIKWIMDPESRLQNDWYLGMSPMIYWPQKPEGGWHFDGMPKAVGGNIIPKNLPVFTATGWFDIFTRGSFNNYQYGLANHSASDKAMIVGPWYHIGAAFLCPGVDGMGLVGDSFIFDWKILRRWFDWKLKGKDDPFMEEFPVAMYVLGEDKWRAEKNWPLPESRVTKKKLFLSKKKAPWIWGDWFSLANASNNYKLVSDTSTSDYYDSFLWWNIVKENPVLQHDPTDLHGLTSRSSQRWLGFSPATVITQMFKYDLEFDILDDNLIWEDERIDEKGVLTFTTEALDEDMEITGPLKLVFWAKTDFNNPAMTQAMMDELMDTIKSEFNIEDQENNMINILEQDDVQWVVEINDVFPNGRARNITSGWLAASHRPYDPANPTEKDPAYTPFDPFYQNPHYNPDTIAENTTYKYVVEIWPTCNVFKKGHRIRLSISGSDFLHLLPLATTSKNTIVLDENHKAELVFETVNKNDEGVTWKWIDDIDGYLLDGAN